MNFRGNFRPISDVDVTALREQVLLLGDEQWFADLSANRRSATSGTLQSVPLVFDPDLRHSHPTRLPPLSQFETALRPVLEAVAEHFEGSEPGQRLTARFGLGYFIRAVFERLHAGASVTMPPDSDFSLVHSHQVHVPVATNANVALVVDTEAVHLPAGRVVEINNRRERSMRNDGDAASIHLLLDFVLPGEACCCGAKRHPDTVCSPAACRDTDQFLVACDCYRNS